VSRKDLLLPDAMTAATGRRCTAVLNRSRTADGAR